MNVSITVIFNGNNEYQNNFTTIKDAAIKTNEFLKSFTGNTRINLEKTLTEVHELFGGKSVNVPAVRFNDEFGIIRVSITT